MCSFTVLEYITIAATNSFLFLLDKADGKQDVEC